MHIQHLKKKLLENSIYRIIDLKCYFLRNLDFLFQKTSLIPHFITLWALHLCFFFVPYVLFGRLPESFLARRLYLILLHAFKSCCETLENPMVTYVTGFFHFEKWSRPAAPLYLWHAVSPLCKLGSLTSLYIFSLELPGIGFESTCVT